MCGIGKTIPVFSLASNHQWNVTLSDEIGVGRQTPNHSSHSGPMFIDGALKSRPSFFCLVIDLIGPVQKVALIGDF
jgi:hypothetical protein